MPTRERRVLVIEDDAFIAMDLCDALEQTGYRVVGPAATVQQAQLLLEEQTPNFAVVDVRLRDGSCSSVVRELRKRGVPFVVHSACRQDEAIAADIRDAPWCPKPAWPGDLLAFLDALPRRILPLPETAKLEACLGLAVAVRAESEVTRAQVDCAQENGSKSDASPTQPVVDQQSM